MPDLAAIDWLWWPALLLWPLGFLGLARQRARTGEAIYLAQQNPLTHASISEKQGRTQRTAIWWLVWTLLLLALARPGWLSDPIPLPNKAREMLLAVDLSDSMGITDMVIERKRYQRLAVLQAALDDFIRQREGDQIGLLLFGTQAYLRAPITSDLTAVRTMLAEAEVGLAGPATAIGDAIGLGLLQLRKSTSEEKVLILATDGSNTAGEVDPLTAAQTAAGEITIYTIGIGKPGTRADGGFDEATLRGIADATGGQFFHAGSPAQLQEIYGAIDALEPVDREKRTLRVREEAFFWPLAAALLLILMQHGLRGIRHVFHR